MTECCGSGATSTLARNLGCSPEDPAGLPDEANMGLSCGNPTALTDLQPGEVVLDLGCVAGAVLIEDARRFLAEAGLDEILLSPKPGVVGTMVASNDPLYHEVRKALPAGEDVGDYAVSLTIQARKPPAR